MPQLSTASNASNNFVIAPEARKQSLLRNTKNFPRAARAALLLPPLNRVLLTLRNKRIGALADCKIWYLLGILPLSSTMISYGLPIDDDKMLIIERIVRT